MAHLIAAAETIDALGCPVACIARVSAWTRRATATDAAHAIATRGQITTRGRAFLVERARTTVGDATVEHLQAHIRKHPHLTRGHIAALSRQRFVALLRGHAIEVEPSRRLGGAQAAHWRATKVVVTGLGSYEQPAMHEPRALRLLGRQFEVFKTHHRRATGRRDREARQGRQRSRARRHERTDPGLLESHDRMSNVVEHGVRNNEGRPEESLPDAPCRVATAS